MLSSQQTLYCGFDPTADSLHVGNLLSLLVLLHGQRAGHNPIVVLGGATVLIGDPSGKTTERPMLKAEDVENNILSLMENVQKIVNNHQQFIYKGSRTLPDFSVFFPGGGADIDGGPYAQSGRYLYDLAIKANDKGDYFPIWGTCLGLELLTVLTAKKNYLKNTDTDNLTLPLRFEKGFQNSRLFRNMPSDVIGIISSEPVTQNNHNWSLLVEDYEKIPALKSFYRILSTNVGRDNKEFISTFEAYKYPFYGVQWHPEKNIFLWATNQVIDHDFNAVKVSQYFANFFVNEARKSSHHFNSTDDEANAVIENAFRVYVPNLNIAEKYYFNYTNEYFRNKYNAH
ncbi:hypothetical protein Btru_067502 [Bulinus truncatus]|nr:hypothetical protein Btru_067502 [Bulinus truncatus]